MLLLDEPEAHLDNDGRVRVELLARRFEGAIVAVSHDRYLLDEIVDQIASLDRGRIRLWPGNYSAYTLERELELRRQQQAYVTQQKEIERLEAAIARFKLWASWVPDKRNIRQANNKQRQIDRMDAVDRPALERRKIALRLRPTTRGGQPVFDLRSVGVTFGDDAVLRDVDLEVAHGERVGVVGRNGAGKSVLLKTLVGEITPTSGEVWVGPSISIGYLSQEQDTLEPASTPLDTVRRAVPVSEADAVSLLMTFLFPYEQARRANRMLSGGERTRLQLLLLMLARPNLLVLDEPTESSRHRIRRGARDCNRGVHRHGRRHLARPLLPRPRRRSHRRGRRQRPRHRRGLLGLARAQAGCGRLTRRWQRTRSESRSVPPRTPSRPSNGRCSAFSPAAASRSTGRAGLRRFAARSCCSPPAATHAGGSSSTAGPSPLWRGSRRSRPAGELAAGLAALAPEVEGLRGATEALRLLDRDDGLAWQCYAMALLAEALADEE